LPSDYLYGGFHLIDLHLVAIINDLDHY